MASHTISKDMETDKYFLIDNVTAEVKQINKNGDYIKKFNIELTGKANYSERVAKAQGDQAYMPYSTKVLQTKPNLYTPQTDKFDGYAQLPRTLQEPYINNTRKRPKTTIEATKYLLEGKEKNKKYLIGKQLQHITGTIHDYFKAKKEGKIEILKMRTETKMQDFVSGGSVKIINGRELTQPQVLHDPPEKRAQSASRIKCDTIPHTAETRAQTSQQSRVIVPLEEQKLKSMQSYGTLNQELQNAESKALFQSRTYNQTSQSKRSQNVIDQNVQLYNIPHFQERLDIFKKEIQSFTLPQPKEIKQITSKGRFNCHLADNQEHYVQDRLMMKLFQPEQFKSNESPKKQEMEKQRRILAKMKEADMLTRNLKLKL
ncbi:unnamed protein product [Paramecium pentaurelia]|uniref:Uncharacterized protein n=1 Tax=Paramecium pentaurelia TaxID=43138 RepID=A0A8S1YF92_9CILI|nr:unnamed protein product [Paramecium pentaurelia]